MRVIGVILGGLLSSTIVMAAVFAIETYTNFNLFGLTAWGVLPVGALMTGMLATGGVYISSKWVQVHPNKYLFLFLLVLAVFSNVLFYAFSYVRDLYSYDLTVSDVGFLRYVDVYLSNLSLSFGSSDVELGSNGKWFAVLDVIGFTLGASSIFLFLSDSDRCATCGDYLRQRAVAESYFSDPEEIDFFYGELRAPELDEHQLKMIAESGCPKADGDKLIYSWTKKILHCVACNSIYWKDELAISRDGDWHQVTNLKRLLPMDDVSIPINLFANKDKNRGAAARDYYIKEKEVLDQLQGLLDSTDGDPE
ncbi:MAG: hypothetical protein GYB49_17525 [Alphaproteobacteria bacterium]|nr:hypothetical protein [Hyphomonas sp.]MBR9809017.1 hypothetical protein [Alphaproteobacteria bacterium]|tara:strand:+ start:783 stop:1706 length:924 start_codon:yes stop_codon:yes gene_type:complete